MGEELIHPDALGQRILDDSYLLAVQRPARTPGSLFIPPRSATASVVSADGHGKTIGLHRRWPHLPDR